MITFEEYYTYLEKQSQLSNFYHHEFKAIAENARYMRNAKVVKKEQKNMEKKQAISFNVLNDIFKEEQKKNGVKAVVKVNTNKDSKLKLFFRKMFGIKPPVISGIIEEFSEYPETSTEVLEKPEVEAVAIEDEDCDDDLEDDFDDCEEEDDLYIEDDYHCDDIIEGQMDIEELNEGDIYEKEKSEKS